LNPEFTPKQSIERMLDEVYGLAEKSENREAFVERALGRFAPKIEGPVRAPGQAIVERRESSARELTMLPRRPPTSVEGERVTPARITAPPTEGAPGRIRPPERLSPEAQAEVGRQALAESEYKPGRPELGLRFKLPPSREAM